MNAAPYPGKRLHHYLEARLHEDRWTVSCATAPRGGFGLGPHESSGTDRLRTPVRRQRQRNMPRRAAQRVEEPAHALR